jgi:hypothetical protein
MEIFTVFSCSDNFGSTITFNVWYLWENIVRKLEGWLSSEVTVFTWTYICVKILMKIYHFQDNYLNRPCPWSDVLKLMKALKINARYWALRKVEYFGLLVLCLLWMVWKANLRVFLIIYLSQWLVVCNISPPQVWCYSRDEIFCCVRSLVRINCQIWVLHIC